MNVKGGEGISFVFSYRRLIMMSYEESIKAAALHAFVTQGNNVLAEVTNSTNTMSSSTPSADSWDVKANSDGSTLCGGTVGHQERREYL